MNNQLTPYNTLTPNLILEAIESIGLHCSGSLFALNSYENRVYQIGIEDEAPLIAKFYRPERWTTAAINEEHQFASELVAHEIPVVAALNLAGQSVHEYQGFRFSLFPRQGGRALELDNLEHLQWMGRFIGRLHAVGACRSFENRLQLNVGTYGQNPYQFLTKHEFIPLEFRSQFDELMPKLLDLLKHNFELVDDLQIIRLHGDCHPGNILWAEDGPWFVDLDDCLMGPAIQDIWMLLTGANEQENRRAVDAILRGYQEFHDFNYDELYLIEALRTLRMIHYSGWLAKRWHDPAFPLNFPWFNSLSYWQEQLYSLQQQVELVEKSCQALKPWGL